MRYLYPLLALLLMASGGYFLVKNEEAGAALVGSGVSMIAIQQIEEHKKREQLDNGGQINELLEGQKRNNDNLRNQNDILRYQIEVLYQEKIHELKSENEKLKKEIQLQNDLITKLKVENAILETRLESANKPKAEPDNLALLPGSSLKELEEYFNPSDQAEEAEYNEIETEGNDNV